MRIRFESLAFVLIASIILACSAAGAAQVFSTTVPICFIENNGQTDEQVLYFADAAGYTLYLTAAGEVISTADPVTVVQIAYQGSNPTVAVSGENKLTGKANFLIGNDKEKWVTDVPTYGSVKYTELYDGISVVYRGGISTLKKEFIVEPGAEPSELRVQYSGQEGLAVDENGALMVTTIAGTFFETPPICYQVVDYAKVSVPCSFVLDGEGIVTFSVGAYDKTLPLIIDPQYDFSTYLGGAQDDEGTGIGLDDAGNVYVVGSTDSYIFPLANAPTYQEHLNGSWDIFASKFSPDGQTLIYSTYIGGFSKDLAGGMVVNNVTEEVTFTGSTDSSNYPCYPPSFVTPKGGDTDAIVTRLNAAGNNLVWSRYIYGNKTDIGTDIALIQSSGETVVVGYTSSDAFPTWPFINSIAGATDGFVIEFANDGNVERALYLGGGKYDYAYGVDVQQSTPWDIWVTGSTKSIDFPVTNPTFRYSNSGGTDAFVTRLTWDLTLDASTYLGGSGNDVGTAIAIDSNLCPYITGYTESPVSPISLFPIKPLNQAFQKTYNGGPWDTFVTKMESNLSALNYSTYLGGLYEEKAYGIAVDNMGRAYVTGYTLSENFPITPSCTIQPTKGLGYLVSDAFVTEVNETGTGLVFSTYLGGTYYDEGNAIAITDDGLNITVTGYTDSINFPIANAIQHELGGFPATRFKDAFVTKIVKTSPVANFTAIPEKGCSPLTVHFNDTSLNNPLEWYWDFGDNTNSTLKNPVHIFYNNATSGSVPFYVNLTVKNCDGSNKSVDTLITVCPNILVNITSDTQRGCINNGTGNNATITFNYDTISGGPFIGGEWDFGDNNTSSITNVHTYYTPALYNITAKLQNSCCWNNSTTKINYIDIRTIPDADFFAIPTSGLIPLHVNFSDNSSGRPSNWTWKFGAGEGTSHLQNPEHTYNIKGSYRITLNVSNFCGCDEKSLPNYIKAGVPNLSYAAGTTMVLPNGTIIVPTNDTTPLKLILQVTEFGLSGYNIKSYWADPVHGYITSVMFPSWATNQSVSSLPDWEAQISAVDVPNQVHPGDINVLLATLNLTGNISTFSSTIPFNIDVNELDDEDGNFIDTNNVPATIMVVRLLPFPGKINPPIDPDEDQIYWDVNGNGRIDFDDVITYYQNMQWIRDNQYHPFFNYNGNTEVPPNYGIDFADLIALFNKVGV